MDFQDVLNNILQNKLSQLDLSISCIDDKKTALLANVLQHNQSLTNLDLRNNQVGDAGARALANALQHNQSLTDLSLWNNQVGDIGASALANALQHNQSLTNLSLWKNQVGDAGACALANALQHNRSLTNLSLWNNQVGNAGASALANALQHNQSLTNLYLWNNQVGDAGACALANALQHNRSLTNLDLRNNQVSDAGACALANALQHNQSLTNLDLGNNQVGDAAERSFFKAWKAHQNRCQLIQEAAIVGDEQELITYFNQYQQFPPAILSLLIQHHQALVMQWETYWFSTSLNYQDNKGNTPLHYAIQLQAYNLIAWLLTKPVALTRCNNNNQSPLSLLESANLLNAIRSVDNYNYVLGACYFSGQGAPINKIKARDYYQKASKEDYKPATWLLNLLEKKTYIEAMAIDTIIGINESLSKLTLDERQTLILSIGTFEGKLSSLLTQQGYTLYHLAAYLGSLEWIEILQTLTSSSTPLLSPNLILRKNQQNLFPSALAKQQAKLITENKAIQLNNSETKKDTVLVRYQACELALQKLEKLRLNLLKDLLIKILTEDNSLALLESQLTELLNLNLEEIKLLLELIATSEYRLNSSLTAQDYTLYHLCALLGSISWFKAVQIFISSSQENVPFFSELILAKTSSDRLRPSELTQRQKHFIVQKKDFDLDSSEATLDKTFQRYQICELTLREEERKTQLYLLLNSDITIESIITELGMLDSKEIKALIKIITTSKGKLIPSLTNKPYTLYHLCALLGSMNWFKELPPLLETSPKALNDSADLILTKIGQQGLRPSELV